MKHYLFIFCLFCGISVQAQKGAHYYWAIKHVPSAYMTPVEPHFRFAVEKRWNAFSINTQLGTSIPRTREIDYVIKHKTWGYAGRFEIRRYNMKVPARQDLDMYIGAEAFYYNADMYQEREYYTDSAENDTYIDELAINKKVWGVVGKYGLQYRFSKHFLLEFSGGLGFKVRNIVEHYRDDLHDQPYKSLDWVKTRNYATNNEITIAFPLIFGFGYYF